MIIFINNFVLLYFFIIYVLINLQNESFDITDIGLYNCKVNVNPYLITKH